MGKLEKIKAELAKLLIKFNAVKTDNGVLNYDGEDLVAGMEVYITNEDGDKILANDGDYTTEDGKVITVKNGKVESIVDVNAEVDAVVDPVTETEDNKETQEVVEDEVKMEDVSEAIENIRKEINELYKIVDSILEKVGETRDEADERLKKLECMSVAKPASEEFEQITTTKKTGDAKLDKFLTNFSK